MSEAIFASAPPKGITVSKPQWVLECAAPAQMWSEIRIAVEGIAINLLASWIFEVIKNRVATPSKRCRINHKEITLNVQNIVIIIQEQLAAEKERDATYAREHHDKERDTQARPPVKPTTDRKNRGIKK